MALGSSLREARIDFLARSISSKEAPSETPSTFIAASTDMSNGGESSARELALGGGGAAHRRRRVGRRIAEERHSC